MQKAPFTSKIVVDVGRSEGYNRKRCVLFEKPSLENTIS